MSGGLDKEAIVEVDERDDAIALHPDLQNAVNYASFQNSVPFLRSFLIKNETEDGYSDLRLTMEVSPPFARNKVWTIDRLLPGDELNLSDCKIELDAKYLDGLNEAENGQVEFRLLDGDQELATISEDIRILARDEWGGFGSMASLIAAFVMPNDPGIAPLLKKTGQLLEQHGHSGALDGYQSNNPKRAYMLGAALWSSIASLRLTYAEPPRSFERQGQKSGSLQK